MPKTRVIFAAIAVLAIMGILFLLVIDVIVRYGMPQYRQVHQYDDDLVHKTIPGSWKMHINLDEDGGEHIKVKINSLGFRDVEFDKEQEGRRVMVYGDSFIEGQFSELNSTFAKALESMLKDTQVINAGIVAYGPDQMLLKMKQELSEYRPDIVIAAIYAGNDFSDLMRNRIFSLENGELAINAYEVDEGLKVRRKLGQYFPSFTLYSHGLNNIKSAISREPSKPADIVARDTNMNIQDCKQVLLDENYLVTNVFVDYHDHDMVLNPGNTCTKYKLDLMRKIIQEMNRLAEDNSAELIVLIIPSKHDVEDEAFHKVVDSQMYPQYNRTFLSSELERMSQGIKYINLYPEFAAQDTPMYWPVDGHWNNEGQKVAAMKIAALMD